MKKILIGVSLAIIALFLFLNVNSKETDEINKISKVDIDAQTKAQEETIASSIKVNDKSLDSTTQNNKDKPWCDWIDESEIVIRLDLPEKYKDKSSYKVGFLHLDNIYNDVHHTARLAREGCDYRVGFNKDDFINFWGIQIPYSEAGLGFYFTYEGQPLQMNLKEGLPDYDGELVLKVTGKVSTADDLSHDILKGQ